MSRSRKLSKEIMQKVIQKYLKFSDKASLFLMVSFLTFAEHSIQFHLRSPKIGALRA
jgi:hypothetical protein